MNNTQDDTNIVPIISPSVSPVVPSILYAKTPPPILNRMGLDSGMSTFIIQHQARRTSFPRRRMPQKRNMPRRHSNQDIYLSVESVEDVTSPSSSFAVITEEDTETTEADNSLVEVEIKRKDVISSESDTLDSKDTDDSSIAMNNDPAAGLSLTGILKDEYFKDEDGMKKGEEIVVSKHLDIVITTPQTTSDSETVKDKRNGNDIEIENENEHRKQSEKKMQATEVVEEEKIVSKQEDILMTGPKSITDSETVKDVRNGNVNADRKENEQEIEMIEEKIQKIEDNIKVLGNSNRMITNDLITEKIEQHLDKNNNQEAVVDNMDMNEQQNSIYVIGGVVVIGIALFVAMNRKRFFL